MAPQPDNSWEFTCARCGMLIHVCIGPANPEQTHCQVCQFILNIEDPEERAQVAATLNRIHHEDQDGSDNSNS